MLLRSRHVAKLALKAGLDKAQGKDIARRVKAGKFEPANAGETRVAIWLIAECMENKHPYRVIKSIQKIKGPMLDEAFPDKSASRAALD